MKMFAISARTVLVVGAIAVIFLGRPGLTADAPAFDAATDAHGNIHVPSDYRSLYNYLGSWAVAQDQGQGSK